MSHLLDPSNTYPVQVPVALSFLSGVWGFSTALKYTLSCSTFCLVSIGGRSNINLMVSVGVSFVVPSVTRIASFCTLSSFSRFVYSAIVVMPSPQSVTLNITPHFDAVERGGVVQYPLQPKPSRLTDISCTSVLLYPHIFCRSTFCQSGSHVFQVTSSFDHSAIKCDCRHDYWAVKVSRLTEKNATEKIMTKQQKL